MLLGPDLTFLPQKRLRLKCWSSTSLGLIRLIKTVNTIKAWPLSHAIYVGIHILLFGWGGQCFGPRPATFTRPDDRPPHGVLGLHRPPKGELSASGRLAAGFKFWRTAPAGIGLCRNTSPNLPVPVPCAPWETQPSFESPETSPGGLWLGQQLLPLFLMVHGMTSNRDQRDVSRHKELLFFCSEAKCGSYS